MFYKKVISNRNEKKIETLMHKPFRLGLLLLDLSKILMYEFWHYYGKPNYGEEVKLCYINCVLLYT